MMLADGSRLRTPISMAKIRNRRIVSVSPLPCVGDGCIDATRELSIRQSNTVAPAMHVTPFATALSTFSASDVPSWSPLRIGSP